WPQSRTNFQHPVIWRKLGRSHNAPQLVRIVQKILAKRFGQLNVALGEDLFHLGELHRKKLREVESSATKSDPPATNLPASSVPPFLFVPFISGFIFISGTGPVVPWLAREGAARLLVGE